MLSKKQMVRRSILKCEYIRFTAQSILPANRANEQFCFDISAEGSETSLGDSYPEIEFSVLHEIDDERLLAADSIK